MIRALLLDGIAVALAIVAAAAPLPAGWIEHGYANGLFAAMNAAFVPLTDAVPFPLGDLEALAVLAALAAWWVRALRGAPRGRRLRTAGALTAHTIAWVAVGVVLFEVLWGWNYRRATIAQRIELAPQAVTDARVAEFSARIVAILNRDVVAAHAETLDLAKLRAAYAPLIARLGDRWEVRVTRPKPTILEPYYEAAGIGGQYSPFAFETLLNASFLPFEVPRALAHEWAHVGGFTDEGDANYVGTLACLRSSDPLIRYSGAYWTYGELPESERRKHRLDPRVVADFDAGRARFLRHYLPQVFAIQWHLYDRYLRSNGVRGGVASYGYFLRLLVGTQLDADGLPRVKAPSARAPAPSAARSRA
ncbi:hypothetical protein WPS_03470 [Vulcanimicrobium alpinum]|uniref:DUF3810 domain-containing protein n=1 Tax=Vulcanimicrobium alpinum TaxID=3016050 RepID=A0AAN1XSQ1_UNVUL|nr:DUF3810 family protein [Vulcanimicrobium alpinum]BDE05071.1 hypothetical protein WPS_03470 [Vulcanimicrobium alpinum]